MSDRVQGTVFTLVEAFGRHRFCTAGLRILCRQARCAVSDQPIFNPSDLWGEQPELVAIDQDGVVVIALELKARKENHIMNLELTALAKALERQAEVLAAT